MQIPDSEPAKLILPKLTGLELDSVKNSLTYTDQKALYQYKNFQKQHWFINKYGIDVYNQQLETLKKNVKQCLLFEEKGNFWTYSGLHPYLSKKLNQSVVQPNPPAPRLLAWDEPPTYQPYAYQKTAEEKLIEARHARVEIGTGLGKSFIITNIIKRLGLKTLVMTPATNISEQLYNGPNGLLKRFGKKKVGRFFEGKKEAHKLITVANGQSLTRIKPGSPEWEELQKVDVFISDESHQCPASTFANVCFGVAAKAKYRFFFSATQMRNDGLDLLLDAITGPTVFEMTVREGVDQGFLSKPIFRMFSIDSEDSFSSNDANAMTRKHLYYNPKVNEHVGNLANAAVMAGLPVLILIEEVEQFTKIYPYLRHSVGFAHGNLNDDNREKVPKDFWESNPTKLVEDFNCGKISILVGTSCISTGTDVQAVKFLIYLQGGKSETQVKQAVGRGTRKNSQKNFCHVVDYDIRNQKVLHKHANARRAIYEDIYGPVNESEL